VKLSFHCLCVISILAMTICSCVQGLSARRLNESAPIPPPGRLIDIGRRRLHLNCTGRGTPAIIAENGMAAFSTDWALVQPEASRLSQFCSYDRVGYAWSDDGPADLVDQTTDDLRTLLRTAGLNPPYVLIGASIGGLYVRAYQRRFPDEVVGLVLDDASSEQILSFRIDEKDKALADISANELRTMFETLSRKPPVPRPLPTEIEEPADRLPKEGQLARFWALRKFLGNSAILPSFLSAESWREEFVAQRAQSLEGHPLGNLPLIVLTRGLNTDDRRKEVAAAFAALSRSGKLVTADRSDHEIHLYRPDLVISALEEVVKAARSGTLKPKSGRGK
jgi:pimeloyl-ACP methyl ester carboxylesterase